MTSKRQKPQPVVTLKIEAGPANPARREAWRRLWLRLLRSEIHQGEKEAPPNQAPAKDALTDGEEERESHG